MATKKRPRDNNHQNKYKNKRERSGSYNNNTILHNNATDGDATEALWSKRPGRDYTVSIALPGSIMQNAQSRELRTYLAGQVGRALAIFNIPYIRINKCPVSDSIPFLVEPSKKKTPQECGKMNIKRPNIADKILCI